ncbi:MAG: CdaR family protein [Thermodesulfobacteriota bacterium]
MWNIKLNRESNPFFLNLGKKTLAIVIAISLWLVANLEFDIERNFEVPINFINLGKEYAIINDAPKKISLRVRGPRNQLSLFAASNFNFTFDLQNIQKGISRIDIQSEQLEVPEDVQIVTISPGEFEIEIDNLTTKSVEVIPIIGEPDEGFEIGISPSVLPSEVVISGPSKILSGINSINTSKISLEDERSIFTIQVPLQLPTQFLKLEKNQLVRVTIDLREKTIEKRLNNIDIIMKNFDNLSYEIESNLKTDLIFKGPYNLIKNLKNEDIEAFIDGKKIEKANNSSEKFKIIVNYPYPDLLNLTTISPTTVNIKFN